MAPLLLSWKNQHLKPMLIFAGLLYRGVWRLFCPKGQILFSEWQIIILEWQTAVWQWQIEFQEWLIAIWQWQNGFLKGQIWIFSPNVLHGKQADRYSKQADYIFEMADRYFIMSNSVLGITDSYFNMQTTISQWQNRSFRAKEPPNSPI